MCKLVGHWLTQQMHLGSARSVEPSVGPLMKFRIGPSNSPKTGLSTGGSPESSEKDLWIYIGASSHLDLDPKEFSSFDWTGCRARGTVLGNTEATTGQCLQCMPKS